MKTRSSIILLVAAVTLALRAAATSEGDLDEASFRTSSLERDLARLLSTRIDDAGFAFFFRPGGAAESGRSALEAKLVPAWQSTCQRLAFTPSHALRVYIYESSSEMTRITGRSGATAFAADEAIHVPLDRQVLGEALAWAAEGPWGRAGEVPGAGLEPGRWTRLRVASRAGTLSIRMDGRPVADLPIEAAKGSIGFAVEDGRIGVRNLRVRALADDGGAADWSYPLRDEAVAAWQPDVPGAFTIGDEELRGVRYGRLARTRFAGHDLADLELECEVRASPGARLELTLPAVGAAPARVAFGASGITVSSGKTERRVAGAIAALHEGLAAAVSAEVAGIDLAPLARALLERGLAPADLCREALPGDAVERARRRVLLGCFVRHEVDRLGPGRYRDLHFADPLAPTPSAALNDAEASFQKWLRGLEISPADRGAAERKLGLDATLGAQWKDILAAIRKHEAELEGQGKSRLDHSLAWRGDGSAAPARLTLPAPSAGRFVARMRVRVFERSRLRVVLRDSSGQTSAGLISTAAADLVTPDGTIAAKSAAGLAPGEWTDVILAFEAGSGRLYLNGDLAAPEVKEGLVRAPAAAVLELEGERVEVESLLVRTEM